MYRRPVHDRDRVKGGLQMFALFALLVPLFIMTAIAEECQKIPSAMRERREMRMFRRERKIF